MNPYLEKRRALGHNCPGIGGTSKSANTSEDNRVTAGSIGISGTGNAVTVTDSGLVGRGLDTVDRSINSVNLAMANLGEGYADLVDATHDIFAQGVAMFNTSQGLIGQTQKSVADAYAQAQADKTGAFDQRTIVMLAAIVAVVAGAYFFSKRKG